MCYFAQDGGMHGSWLSGSYVPPAPITRALCAWCASVEVTFTVHIFPDGRGHWHQDRPWKWAPIYGGPCNNCGKEC